MTGGGFAISRSQNGNGRLYNSPAVNIRTHDQQNQQNQHYQQVRRHQQLLRQQQHIQIQRHQQHFQRPPPPSVAAFSADVQAKGDDSRDSRGTLPTPPAFLPPPLPVDVIFPPPPLPPQVKVTNLDRLLESVSPTIPAKDLHEVTSRGWKSGAAEVHPFYSLNDLWGSYREWSVYGAGVPLVLNEKDSIIQYYVPYLSGIQLYIDPLKPLPTLRQPGGGSEVGSRTNQAGNLNTHGRLVFEYFEHEQPHLRQPLTDKVRILEYQFPELRMYKSSDLLPSSWLCVAWYPIYRIPVGPTLKDLEASFLTFHSLSTNFLIATGGQPSTSSSVMNGQTVTLPAFGLASYKLKGSIMAPCGPHECKQENALLQAAHDWLNRLQRWPGEKH